MGLARCAPGSGGRLTLKQEPPADRKAARLHPIPLTLKQANELVGRLHRHHKPVVGHRFSIGCQTEGGELVGAVIVGRPLARKIDQWTTAEVTRLVTDGTPNACSMLYAAAWRAWRAMGGTRMITYTLASEQGGSLVAAGWKELYRTKGSPTGWSASSRPRESGPQEPKTLWEVLA